MLLVVADLPAESDQLVDHARVVECEDFLRGNVVDAVVGAPAQGQQTLGDSPRSLGLEPQHRIDQILPATTSTAGITNPQQASFSGLVPTTEESASRSGSGRYRCRSKWVRARNPNRSLGKIFGPSV